MRVYGLPVISTTLFKTPFLGAPCPVKLCEDVVNELNAKNFTIGYGMTETSPITFQGFPNDSVKLKTSTIGFPADHTEVKGKKISEIISIIPNYPQAIEGSFKN